MKKLIVGLLFLSTSAFAETASQAVRTAETVAKADISFALVALNKLQPTPAQICFLVGSLRSSLTTAKALNVDLGEIGASDLKIKATDLEKWQEARIKDCQP